MTLDEAIKLEEHTSENYYSLANTYHTDEGVYLTMETKARNQAEYHEQLADWLKDYKRLLEQEPCDDCVSRQAVIKKIFYTSDNNCDVVLSSELMDRIKALPPVTPQPKIGEWIKYGRPRCGEQHYQCTSCGYYINFGQWGELYTKEFKYCPNCGAKMTESEEADG